MKKLINFIVQTPYLEHLFFQKLRTAHNYQNRLIRFWVWWTYDSSDFGSNGLRKDSFGRELPIDLNEECRSRNRKILNDELLRNVRANKKLNIEVSNLEVGLAKEWMINWMLWSKESQKAENYQAKVDEWIWRQK